MAIQPGSTPTGPAQQAGAAQPTGPTTGSVEPATPLPANLAELRKLRELSQLREQGNGERRGSGRWPVELPLEGWLQLNGQADPPIPVDLLDLSSGGVKVVLGAEHAVPVGAWGELITQAHGGGCGSRSVRCCWQAPHQHDPGLQCLGLAFETPG